MKISVPVSVKILVDPSEGTLGSELTPESEKVLEEELPVGPEGQHIRSRKTHFYGFESLSRAVAETFSAYGQEYENISFSVSVRVIGVEMDLFEEGDLEGLVEEIEPEEEMKRCSECGRVSFDRSERCSECGRRF